MLKRRSQAQPSEAYFNLHPIQIKKSNPYLVKLEAMKEACSSPVKINKNYISRKSSSQHSESTGKNSFDPRKKYNTGYQYGKSSEFSSPYLKKKNKQIQYSLTTSQKLSPQQWNQGTDSVSNKLSHSTIAHLSQFIDYYLHNSLVRAQWNKNLELEMQNNPLYILQTQIEAAKLELQKQQNNLTLIKQETLQKEQKTKDEIQHLEQENELANIEILRLINSHTEHRNLLRAISTLQKQISDTKIRESLKLQEAEANIRAQLQAHAETNVTITNNIERTQQQMNVIIQLRQSVEKLTEMIIDSKKTQDEQMVIYKQLIQQKSAKDMKEDLSSSTRFQGTLLSNKQILDNFYKSIEMKQLIIKNTVLTHSENHQFETSLEIKQAEQAEQVNLTVSRNTFNEDEKNFLSLNKSQFDVYDAYLRTDSQVKKTEAHLDLVYDKYEKGLNQMGAEVENIKKVAADQLKKMRELQNIEAIRQAEIQQLNQILNSKKQQLNKIKSQKSSFDIFRSSIL